MILPVTWPIHIFQKHANEWRDNDRYSDWKSLHRGQIFKTPIQYIKFSADMRLYFAHLNILIHQAPDWVSLDDKYWHMCLYLKGQQSVEYLAELGGFITERLRLFPHLFERSFDNAMNELRSSWVQHTNYLKECMNAYAECLKISILTSHTEWSSLDMATTNMT